MIGVDDRSKLQRNANNSSRILREFPWLWAVQHEWQVGYIIMRVSDEDLTPFFRQKVGYMGMGNDRLYGFYIHGMRKFMGGPNEFVTPIWNGRDDLASIRKFPEMEWYQTLTPYLDQSDENACRRASILHIVLVYWGWEAMVVYRPKKPAVSYLLNFFTMLLFMYPNLPV